MQEGVTTDRIDLVLPFPPSVNGYWRHVIIPARGAGTPRAATLISAEGRKYAQDVAGTCKAVRVSGLRIDGDLAVSVTLYPPDRRARDVDNYCKALLDALTKAGVWHDDSQLSRLVVERMAADPARPRAEVIIQVRQAQGRLG